MLVHPKEKILFIVSLVFSAIAWIALIVSTVGIGLLFVIFGIIVGIITKQIFIARIKGFGIKISEKQYPLIYNEVKRISDKMNLENIPHIYMYDMGGILNAFSTHIFSRNFVVLSTTMLDACGDDQELLSFVIAHEITHLVRKHTRCIGILLPSRMFPWLGHAYSRSCEYTCDAFAAKYGAISLEKTKEAVSILATSSGARSRLLNEESYLKQAKDVQAFWPATAYTNSSHPFTSMRYARIVSLLDEKQQIPKLNFLGALLSPLFSVYTIFILYIIFALITFNSSTFDKDAQSVKPITDKSLNLPEKQGE